MAKKAAKRKRTKHGKTRVIPAIAPSGSVNFSNLKGGECFLMNGSLWIKGPRSYTQAASSLVDGKRETSLCGRMVQPVNVEIKWAVI